MDRELQRYLDGERTREGLPPEVAAEADAWEALLEAAERLHEDRAPAWLEARVMQALLPAGPRPSAAARLVRWLFEPRTVRLRPMVAGLAAAAVASVLLLGPRPGPPDAEPVAGVAPVVYVQFVFAGEAARTVAVAGDFNGWEPAASLLRDPDGDGVWTGLFALPAGVHKYMFLVDGERWVTDPRAERYVEDGFGMRNALISVSPPPGRSS